MKFFTKPKSNSNSNKVNVFMLQAALIYTSANALAALRAHHLGCDAKEVGCLLMVGLPVGNLLSFAMTAKLFNSMSPSGSCSPAEAVLMFLAMGLIGAPLMTGVACSAGQTIFFPNTADPASFTLFSQLALLSEVILMGAFVVGLVREGPQPGRFF